MPSGGSKKTAKAAEAKKKEPEKKRTKADPLFPKPSAAIAARGDLVPGPVGARPGGAYDAKIASGAMLAADLSVSAIAGPTTDDQPVFAWTGAWARQDVYPHYGHPSAFNFSWLTMKGVPSAAD